MAKILNLCSPGGGVGFSLNGTTYPNNSLVTLEDIGEGDEALLCMTDQTACCRTPYTSGNGSTIGNWYFPNGTRVRSSGNQGDLYRTRGHMVVRLHRRRGREDGVYSCVVPDALNVTQTIYIGVYTASAGEQYINIPQKISDRNSGVCFYHWYVPLNVAQKAQASVYMHIHSQPNE